VVPDPVAFGEFSEKRNEEVKLCANQTSNAGFAAFSPSVSGGRRIFRPGEEK
jgi:hypothetical protein